MIPMNLEQKLAIELMSDENIELVTLSGVFGTAKSYTMLNMALDLYDRGLFKKIYICKAPIPLDKIVMTGFKPSGFMEKMQLPLGSITTNIENSNNNKNGTLKGFDILQGYIMHGIIEIISLEDVLGMSLNPNSILIIEEFETMTKEIGLAILSRIGSSSKIYANGDLRQKSMNNLLPENTALFHTINVFAGYEKAAHLTMTEVVRSGFVKELALRWYS
jgi:PhoH-like ATPase